MSEPIISKSCSKCKQIKPLSEFGKDRRKKNGLRSRCKSCQKAYRQTDKGKAGKKAYQQSERGKAVNRKIIAKRNARNPNYVKAKNAVMIAIRAGRLPRADCFLCYYCQKPAQQYHHWHGYEPECWLDVIPVCIECHLKEHRKTA